MNLRVLIRPLCRQGLLLSLSNPLVIKTGRPLRNFLEGSHTAESFAHFQLLQAFQALKILTWVGNLKPRGHQQHPLPGVCACVEAIFTAVRWEYVCHRKDKAE